MSAADLRAIPPSAWNDLAGECLVGNPFYVRQYVLAGLDTIDRREAVSAVAVTDTVGRLLGLFPFARRWDVALGAWNVYQFSGAPLIARGEASAVVETWLDGIAAGRWPAVWSLPHTQLNTPLADLVSRSASKRGLETITVMPYTRPQLTREAASFHEHLDRFVAKARRRDIERSIRRLRELGELRLERHEGADATEALLPRFLSMEAAGWKGEAGTAFLSRVAHADFARRAFGGAEYGSASASLDVLTLDARPIAMSLNLRAGTTLFTPKCTFDESLRRYSPGIVLEYFVVERFFSDDGLALMDAATTVDGHLVQGLWNGVAPMGHLLLGTPTRTRILARFLKSREQVKQAAKRLLRGRAMAALLPRRVQAAGPRR